MIVKICGNRTREDLLAADRYGADILGVVVEVKTSRRAVDRVVARNLFIVETRADKAMLLCDHGLEETFELVETVKPAVLHLTGSEPPDLVEAVRRRFRIRILKSAHLPPAGDKAPDIKSIISKIAEYADAGVKTMVIDTSDPSRKLFGGTGKTSDWDLAAAIVAASSLPVLLAGGISPDNAREAILKVKPHGIDLASGVESAYGVKDPSRIKKLFEIMREFRRDGAD